MDCYKTVRYVPRSRCTRHVVFIYHHTTSYGLENAQRVLWTKADRYRLNSKPNHIPTLEQGQHYRTAKGQLRQVIWRKWVGEVRAKCFVLAQFAIDLCMHTRSANDASSARGMTSGSYKEKLISLRTRKTLRLSMYSNPSRSLVNLRIPYGAVWLRHSHNSARDVRSVLHRLVLVTGERGSELGHCRINMDKSFCKLISGLLRLVPVNTG